MSEKEVIKERLEEKGFKEIEISELPGGCHFTINYLVQALSPFSCVKEKYVIKVYQVSKLFEEEKERIKVEVMYILAVEEKDANFPIIRLLPSSFLSSKEQLPIDNYINTFHISDEEEGVFICYRYSEGKEVVSSRSPLQLQNISHLLSSLSFISQSISPSLIHRYYSTLPPGREKKGKEEEEVEASLFINQCFRESWIKEIFLPKMEETKIDRDRLYGDHREEFDRQLLSLYSLFCKNEYAEINMLNDLPLSSLLSLLTSSSNDLSLFLSHSSDQMDEEEMIIVPAYDGSDRMFPRGIPYAICHLDIHDENLLFKDDKETIDTLLDWSDLTIAPVITDLAVAVIYWSIFPPCDGGDVRVKKDFNLHFAQTIISHYQQHRKVTKKEKECFAKYCLFSIMYFTATFLNDFQLEEEYMWLRDVIPAYYHFFVHSPHPFFEI